MSSSQTPISNALPSEILTLIFCFLDASSLSACSVSSKVFYHIIEHQIWKQISHRDYFSFLLQTPLETQEFALPVKTIDIQVKNESFPDANRVIKELRTGKYNQSQHTLYSAREWKKFYSEKHQAFNLNGYWVGNYGKGNELIRIYQNGYHLVAKKLTGDTNVPSGKITWEMHMNRSVMKGTGKFQLTETNYENPRLTNAYLQVMNKNTIQITWLFQHYSGHWYTVTFVNIRAGCGNFDEKTMNRKINLLQIEENTHKWLKEEDKNGQCL